MNRRAPSQRHPTSSVAFGCVWLLLALVGGLVAIVAAFSIRDPDDLLVPNFLRVLGL